MVRLQKAFVKPVRPEVRDVASLYTFPYEAVFLSQSTFTSYICKR